MNPPVAVIDSDHATSAKEFVARLAYLVASGYARSDIRVTVSVAKLVAADYRADPDKIVPGVTIQGVRVV